MNWFKSRKFCVGSPADGGVVALLDLQDEVFKNKMMGDGVAIEPVDGEFVAPFDGVVVHVAPTKHAIIIRASNEVSVLIHMGIDTVYLGGEAFLCFVAEGQHVQRGDLLARMDLNEVFRRGKSIISPVIVVDGKEAKIKATNLDFVKKQDLLLTVKL